MLSGLRDTGESMFQHLSPSIAPDPEELERERQRVLFNKTVKVKKFNCKTYDLGDNKQRVEYTKKMKELYHGIVQRTHVLLFNDRRFVEDNKGPRWIAHIEWIVFELNIEPNTMVGQGDTNGQESTED